MNRRILLGVVTLALTLPSLSAVPASGQPYWMPREEAGGPVLMFEFLRPNVESIDRSFLSSTYFLSARVPASSTVSLVGELPYSNFKATLEGTDINGNPVSIEESGSTIGKPYVGLELSSSDSPVFGELGVRVPLVNEDELDARALGLLTDVSRWEAFLPKAVFVQGAFNVREVTDSKVEYRLRLSPVVLIATDKDFYPDGAELFGVYAWTIGYHGSFVRVGTGLSGRVLLSESAGNLGERSLNQFELHADIGSWSLRPAFEMKVPLGTLADTIPVVLGASVSWGPKWEP